ncbi:hypothetical protein ACVW1A_001336 [Bradyrhizobium sp. LB1.3]
MSVTEAAMIGWSVARRVAMLLDAVVLGPLLLFAR